MSESRNETGNLPALMGMFRHSLVERRRLHNILNCAGPLGGGTGIVVSGDAGMLSRKIVRAGGMWHVYSPERPGFELKRELLGSHLSVIQDLPLPVSEHSLDVLVVVDFLEFQAQEEAWIREFNRMLKPGGRLVIAVPAHKSFSLARIFRKALGFPESEFRPTGYRNSDIYNLVKNGFDILEYHTDSRFGAELADAFLRRVGGMAAGDSLLSESEEVRAAGLRRAGIATAIFSPFARIFSWMDLLLFFTRGHRLVAAARSRAWKERREVKIRDGRSIAEATIQTRIGTAAEF